MTQANPHLNLQDKIDLELVNSYLYQSRIAVYCSFILIPYLGASFYQQTATKNILIWMAVIFAVNLAILFTSLQFRLDMPTYQISFFRNRQHFLHLLSGLAWGAAFFLLLDHSAPQAGDYRVATVVAIVIALSATTKAASMRGLVNFLAAVMAVSLVFFIANFANFAWWLFGLIGLVFVTYLFGWMSNKYVVGQIENRVLNESYVEELRALNEKIETVNQDFIKRNLELQEMQNQLQQLASNDSLTGLFNRRYILERVEEKMPEIKRYQLDCCFVMMDVDYFKNVNDQYGHLVGDEILRSVSQLLIRGVRLGDIVARYGGEEFLIFLPMTDLISAETLVERLRYAIEMQEYKIEGHQVSVTASFGIAQHEHRNDADRTISQADKALYQAKVNGRNCIVLMPRIDGSADHD